jgi:hypothetical protein
MRVRVFVALGSLLCTLLVGSAAGVSSAAVETATLRAVPVALGARSFMAPYGKGWGTAHPRRIDNGGVPSGIVYRIRWRHWGTDRAVGRGLTYIYKPAGGYYRQPGRIVLRAQRLDSCRSGGRPAYTRLRFRNVRRPGGPIVGPWRGWTGGTGNICR